jgi:hypothetical protein
MSEGAPQHTYQIGDTVLVHVAPGVDVPGVIEDERNGQFQVRLAQAWTDESGAQTGDLWADPDKLEAFAQEETGGQQSLPRP